MGNIKALAWAVAVLVGGCAAAPVTPTVPHTISVKKPIIPRPHTRPHPPTIQELNREELKRQLDELHKKVDELKDTFHREDD